MSTAVLFGSARIDEHGNITGGQAGDQTGKEVSTQPFYLHKKGWSIFRPKDKTVAAKLAKAMLDACNNNHIGYDQNSRTAVITMLKKYGSLAKIAENTEADCSSLVRACCIEVGFDPGNFTTASASNALLSCGQFRYAGKATKAEDCLLGDIICTTTKGHIVIVVSVTTGDPQKAAPVITTTNSDKKVFAKNRDEQLAGTYVVTASELNLRMGPDVTYATVAKLPKGTECQCYGYYTSTGGVKWFYVVAEGKTGFVASTYLKRK